MLYWSEKIGCKEIHPTVARAVRISPSLCERAWGQVRDKLDNERNRDLSEARRIENLQAYFVYWLKRYVEEAEAEARAKRAMKAR